jgi:pyrroloquinoline quinone biosynthesis protein B
MKRLLAVSLLLAVSTVGLLCNPVGQRETPGPQGDGPPAEPNPSRAGNRMPKDDPYLVVLGVAQDAGHPQAGCRKACCALAWDDHRQRHYPVCVAVVDPRTRQRWIFDCTPSFPDQLRLLDEMAPSEDSPGISGILLTHAHVGHYTGLIHLGREVMGARGVPVYAMPRMTAFLRNNGPWSSLIDLRAIHLMPLADGRPVRLNGRIQVTPLVVPHRGEWSETVGFRIRGPGRSALYLPDIDKWERWQTEIEQVLREVDVAYLDGTFYADGEIPGRDMRDIPHPFIVESIRRFSRLDPAERAKVRFVHLNHTNPALRTESEAARAIRRAGQHVARRGERFPL